MIVDRLAGFAASLREVGAIRSDAVERAFASVARHHCVPELRHGPETVVVPQDKQPGREVLDAVYSHRSLVTSTGGDGGPPSSSSTPPLMARMLEALDLRPGMRVLEIGAGTGYNAALIATITSAPVVTVDAGAAAARGAAEAICRLGLDRQVTVEHGDGYLGAPAGGPYHRIIVTCGVAGLSPHWLDQLAPGGMVLVPVAHGGVHPVLAASHDDGTVTARAVLWADFMPAAGPLRPAELVGRDPADYLPPAPVTVTPDASPARTTAAYHDLWFFLATRDPRITRAYPRDDSIDASLGACALHAPPGGTAWVHSDGSISATGEPTVAGELRGLIDTWTTQGRPTLTAFDARLDLAAPSSGPLWVPRQWVMSDESRTSPVA